MRGKAAHWRLRTVRGGITPAYAGKSGRGVLLLSTFWDHPRVCGEKFCYVPSLYNLLGSPPRMRGKGHMVFQFFPAHGITPAYAGKSSHSGKRWCFLWDHPRVCGEKQRKWMLRTFIRGSPPRMRGKVLPRAVLGPASGITPAYAGKRQRFSSRCECRGDHPRVCGEKEMMPPRVNCIWGSPPRMRGKVDCLRHLPCVPGITPAYAGKRHRGRVPHSAGGDHPRVCGEKSDLLQLLLLYAGSPPRMRGKGKNTNRMGRAAGITPAYAGKRLKRSHRIGHFSCILCLFHSVLHRASASGGSRAGPCAPPCLPAQNAVPV